MSVTISDVASKAGVSTSTVSKVINNNPTISAETTARVNAAIKELHYIPNSRAVSFAKGQAKNIVYLSTLGKDIAYENPHMFDIMCGVYHELTSHHYMMSLVDTSEESYPGERAIVEIKKRSADGLIIHGSIVNETLAKHLLRKKFLILLSDTRILRPDSAGLIPTTLLPANMQQTIFANVVIPMSSSLPAEEMMLSPIRGSKGLKKG